MSKLSYLNVGCGGKFHKDWTNVDMVSQSPYVKAHNLLKGFPYETAQFEVVYHSQVLEHFPKEKAFDFLAECYRVLKPGGIIRVVVPDLENIVTEYLKYLNKNLSNPTKLSEANYDWILLEMYDQTVRNYSGGQMAQFLIQPDLINEKYVVDRCGYVARGIIENSRSGKKEIRNPGILRRLRNVTLKKLIRYGFTMWSTEASRLGSFRLGGEIHMWMYDRFSLSRLLREVGFDRTELKSPYESQIQQWGSYELDVKDGLVFDPTSLFMEATKPL